MAIGAGLSLLGAGGKFLSGLRQTRESTKINPVWQQYQTNPFARKQLYTAQNAYSGRMAGAPQLERNIFSSGANFMSNVNRNATDSSQALALAAAGQGQTNESLSNLQTQEAQNKYSMLNNLNRAYGTMIGEGDKTYQSLLQKYQMDAERKDALRSAGAQNKFGAVSDLASMAFTAGTSGAFGGRGGTNATSTGMQIPNTNTSGVGGRLNWMGNQNKRWNPTTGKFE